MNSVVVVLVCAAILLVGYVAYGRWVANKWGIDKKALTPAVRMENGKDFSPSSCFSVFAHQFSSICGAGPVTGTIVAMMFGWLPVVLWVLVGGIFFGAVHDFGALYASIKNNGKSLGQLIEKYIGRTGRRLFLLFCWLFCIIVIAAFTSMVAGTFTAVMTNGALDTAKSYAGGAAGSISIVLTVAAVLFGWANRKFGLTGVKQYVLAFVLIAISFAIGCAVPIYLDQNAWFAIIMVYLFLASTLPIQALKQPRDFLTVILMFIMIACAFVGIFVLGANGQATITAPMLVDSATMDALAAKGNYLFPVLFVSVACGALSGFHSLVSSNTSSKQLSNESHARPVGYGAMILESFVAILAIVFAGVMYSDMNTAGTGALNNGAASTPFQIFAAGIARGMTLMGFDQTFATVFMTMCVAGLALTSLDAVARIARTSFQELLYNTNDALASAQEVQTGARKIFTNTYVATVLTLVLGLALAFGGYLNIWPLFGASNQLLGGMTMITLAVFCKCTGRKGWMLYVPVAFLLVCTFTSLAMSIVGCVTALSAGVTFTVLATKGLQLVFAILIVILGIIVAYNCLKELFTKKAGSIPDEEPEWTELGRENVAKAAAENNSQTAGPTTPATTAE